MFVTIVRRHPVMAFFCLAFGLSWSVQVPAVFVAGWPELLTFLGSFGPAVAAFTIVSLDEGREGARRLVSGLAKWKTGMGWYVAVLLGPAITVVDEPLFSLAILALFDLLIIIIAGPGLLWKQPHARGHARSAI